MVMLLGDEQAAQILAQLEPRELRLLGEKMCALGEIDPEVIAHAIAGFVDKTERLGVTPHDRIGHVRSLMTRAVGEVKAGNLMQRIAPDEAKPSPLDLARWLTPQALAPLVKGEHPQAIAVLLVQLDPEVAAEVLHSLPPAMQPEVVHRIATLGPVSAEAIAMLEELLAQRIGELHGQDAFAMGGVREAADIINNSGKAMEKRVMPEIAKLDKVARPPDRKRDVQVRASVRARCPGDGHAIARGRQRNADRCAERHRRGRARMSSSAPCRAARPTASGTRSPRAGGSSWPKWSGRKSRLSMRRGGWRRKA